MTGDDILQLFAYLLPIKTAKNTTIQIIRSAAMSESDSADKLREDILNQTLDKQSPSSAALAYIKKEVSELW